MEPLSYRPNLCGLWAQDAVSAPLFRFFYVQGASGLPNCVARLLAVPVRSVHCAPGALRSTLDLAGRLFAFFRGNSSDWAEHGCKHVDTSLPPAPSAATHTVYLTAQILPLWPLPATGSSETARLSTTYSTLGALGGFCPVPLLSSCPLICLQHTLVAHNLLYLHHLHTMRVASATCFHLSRSHHWNTCMPQNELLYLLVLEYGTRRTPYTGKKAPYVGPFNSIQTKPRRLPLLYVSSTHAFGDFELMPDAA